MTGGLTKPAAEPRAHKVTQGVPACDAGIAADADVCKHRKCKTHPRTRHEGLGACFAGMAAREVEPDLRKAAREAARRA